MTDKPPKEKITITKKDLNPNDQKAIDAGIDENEAIEEEILNVGTSKEKANDALSVYFKDMTFT